jgi:hypothetical protein
MREAAVKLVAFAAKVLKAGAIIIIIIHRPEPGVR